MPDAAKCWSDSASKWIDEDLSSVVEDYAERLAVPGADATHAVTEIYAIHGLRTLNGTVMNCEDDRIALTQWYDHGPRLYAWPLLRQQKFATSEISLGFR